MLIPILLYVDDIVLILDSRHLEALQHFFLDMDLTMNLKVMVFNTSQAWITRSEHHFTLGGKPFECDRSSLGLYLVDLSFP